MAAPPGSIDVDVVVPTIGRASLERLLRALAAADGPLPRRVLLVDDRSHRRRPLVGEPVPSRLTRLVEVVDGPARGPAAARNAGWRRATASWVAFLDDDVIPGPAWLSELAADLAGADADVAAIQGRVRVPLPAGRRPTDWERNVARLEGARWITADMAVRRSALRRVGGFDERFPRPYREDADLALRLASDGSRIEFGRRQVEHRVEPAPWWISLKLQAGNADDVLMNALHGRGWRSEGRWVTRRPRHLMTVALGLAGMAGLAANLRPLALAGGAGWTLATAELAWARIAPGPRDAREVATMAVTSVLLPPLAIGHWLAGLARRRHVLADTARAPKPEPAVEPGPAAVLTGTVQGNGAAGDVDPLRPPLPRSLQLEITAACNLRCPMCLVRYRPPVNRVTGSMDYETVRRLLEDLPEVDDITLQGLGEPLLAPDLVPIVSHAARRGIKVGFNTNATLLTAAKAEALVEAGLDWLCISLDGASAEAYERIRDGARFERVRRNIETLVEVRRRHGSPDRPRLSLVFVAMRSNVDELPGLLRLASEWGIDDVSVQNLSHSFEDTEADGPYEAIRRFTAREALWAEAGREPPTAFGEARRLADELGVALHLPAVDERPGTRPEGTPGCDWPWRAAYVSHDGHMQPCCMVMGSDRSPLGDLRRESFRDAWHGEEYRAFRSALLTDDPPAVCHGCSLYRGVF